MEYIKQSEERPLGLVQELWYRYEFQDEAGAAPQLHAVISTLEDTITCRYFDTRGTIFS